MSWISVVIPTMNEADSVAETIGRVSGEDALEVIVVDGGSVDDTRAVAHRLGAQVLDADLGRGTQMAAGEAVSRGELLVFLHADTLLPAGWAAHVRRILATPGVAAGAFGLRIGEAHRRLRLVEFAVAARSRLLGMPYGDQAIFLRRSMLERIGGIPDLPVMEDFELVRRVRRRGRIAIAPAHVTTSPRRWLTDGTIRTTLLNQWCLAHYLLGASPSRIARWRRGSPRPVDTGDCKPTMVSNSPLTNRSVASGMSSYRFPRHG